nr:MAG TPA: hypothetical protein [Caudoviricetes sp.]
MSDKKTSWLDIVKYGFFVIRLKIEAYLLNKLMTSSTELYKRCVNTSILHFLEAYEDTNESRYKKFLESIEDSKKKMSDEDFDWYSKVYVEGFTSHYDVEKDMRRKA